MAHEIVYFSIGYSILGWVVTAVLHIAIAVLIHADANKTETDRIPPFVPPWIWTMAALLGGILTLAVYWLMYHSTLRKS